MQLLPQTPLDWILVAVALSTATIIMVALQDFFVDSRVPNPRVRALQDVGVIAAVTHFGVLILRGSAGPNWAIAGIALYVASSLLFLSALESARRVPMPRAFVDDPAPATLITRGPFALIRHPFYTAYALAWLAAPIATHGPLIGVATLAFIVLYVVAARREERQLEARFGDSYRAYKMSTGMLLPPVARLVSGRS